ncbi:MAG TPA: metallophosphoesterase family protein [Anaerolineae bacterium]|nr:metallophosphoesterase family protein [Anaerolineae bacterium]HXV99924.1 metallophosphoesterase family protein [Anaerolineae bacterium]
MRYAIFSDIHNHAEALSTVLSHASQQAVDQYFCLGDVGIDACVELVREVGAPTVFGNWEVSGWSYLSPENQRWVLKLPPVRKKTQFWLTHATPLWPTKLATLADLHAHRHDWPMSQLFPYLHFESPALWKIMGSLTQAGVSLMFHGHTHRQMAWRFTADNHLQKLTHRIITLRPGDTLVVGVGSVGRPEDGPGAAYVIYDDKVGQIELLRV